ncbi:hypothetical protein EI94DRAFT_1702621 [Lactarius quietus]|nr:hypothetical protein EI94DRAFT_1702621 [Lactarius quietus]
MDKGLRTVLVLKFSNKATFQCRNNWNSLPHGSHSICPTSLPFVTRGIEGRRCEAVPPPGQNAFHARRQAPAHPPPPPSKCLGDTARKVALATPSRRIPTQGIQGSQGIQKTSIVKIRVGDKRGARESWAPHRATFSLVVLAPA